MTAKGILKSSSGTVPRDVTREYWCTSSNMEDSYRLHVSELVKYGVAEYNTSYDETVEGSEEIIFKKPSHIICYNETRFQLTYKRTSINTNVERILRASESYTGEVLLSRY